MAKEPTEAFNSRSVGFDSATQRSPGPPGEQDLSIPAPWDLTLRPVYNLSINEIEDLSIPAPWDLTLRQGCSTAKLKYNALSIPAPWDLTLRPG